ncbi:MAG: PKD domain-containing protein, partial [Flavobacteriales bacterium]
GACGAYAVDSVSITVNPAPTVNVTATQDTICPSGSTVLTASGANTYSWSPATGLSCTNCASPTANPSSTTSYTVIGTNSSNCTSSTSFTVYVDQPPTADYLLSDDTVCAGQQVVFNGGVSINASGFSWSFPGGTPSTSTSVNPTVTYSSAGSYSFTLTVNNTCGDYDSISGNVEIISGVTANYTQSADTVCENDYVNYDASSSVGALSYSWSFPGGTPSTSTSVAPSIQYTTAGVYSFVLSAIGSSCTDTTSGTILVEVCGGMEDNQNTSSVFAFYHSASEQLVISHDLTMKDDVLITLYNNIGQFVLGKTGSWMDGKYKTNISLSNLPVGYYNLIINGNHTSYFTRFIRN